VRTLRFFLDWVPGIHSRTRRSVALDAILSRFFTMPSVAGMGLEFSCGEDPKLVPAAATGAERHGAAPEDFVEIMTTALKGAWCADASES